MNVYIGKSSVSVLHIVLTLLLLLTTTFFHDHQCKMCFYKGHSQVAMVSIIYCIFHCVDDTRKCLPTYSLFAKCSAQSRRLEAFIHHWHTQHWCAQIWHTQSQPERRRWQGEGEASCQLQICLQARNGNTSLQHCDRQHHHDSVSCTFKVNAKYKYVIPLNTEG